GDECLRACEGALPLAGFDLRADADAAEPPREAGLTVLLRLGERLAPERKGSVESADPPQCRGPVSEPTDDLEGDVGRPRRLGPALEQLEAHVVVTEVNARGADVDQDRRL